MCATALPRFAVIPLDEGQAHAGGDSTQSRGSNRAVAASVRRHLPISGIRIPGREAHRRRPKSGSLAPPSDSGTFPATGIRR